jgi:hypothetical protein
MMKRIPFADASPDRDDHCGGPESRELLVARPKAAFQWPPRLRVAVQGSRAGQRYLDPVLLGTFAY